MYDDNFTTDPEEFQKIKELQIEKEKILFLALCSESDSKLILNEEKMTVRDFERITYLLQQLGLHNYCAAFGIRHSDLLKELGKQIEYDVLNDTADADTEMFLRKHWDDAFLSQLPKGKIRTYLKKLFE